MKDRLNRLLRLLPVISAVVALLPSAVIAQNARLEARPYVFDTEPAGAATVGGAYILTPGDVYSSARGYGWTVAPTEAFVREKLDRSRTALTIDGVTARHLAFRADVPQGDWRVMLQVEAGKEDSSTLAIVLGGERQAPGWYAFEPPAEPRTEIQRIYRAFQGRTHVGVDGLTVELIGGGDDVRLLGLTLIPDPVPVTAEHRALLERIQAAGRYDALVYDPASGAGSVYAFQTAATDELDHIAADLERLAKRDPSDAFAAYWLGQLRTLATAERYFARRGWEWARQEDGFGLFDRLNQCVMLLDAIIGQPDAEAAPLFERALYTRGRLLYWLGLERGGPDAVATGRRDLARLRERHPDDQLLAMYAGKRVDLADPCDDLRPAANAPAWSAAELETLCRLRGLAHWWIEDQQGPNGEMGGKPGDDVELLRWWPPLVLSGDTTVLRGWRRLADGVWNSDEIAQGFAREVSDVEHASEFISDTAPQLVVFLDDPEYVDRLRYSARHMANLWTGITPGGHRHFRSAWLSSTEIDTEPPKNRDVEYNSRAVKAVRYLAWKTGNPTVVKLLHEWSSAWADAAMRTDKGKPAGIIPASIRYPDEAINGDAPTWYQADMFWDYFDWDHYAGSVMMDQLLFTYTLTGDSTLLRPIRATLDLVQTHPAPSGTNGHTLSPGSVNWAAEHLRNSAGFWSTVAQWRLYTGDTRYDDLLMRYGTPYLRYRLTGDERYLAGSLQPILDKVRFNTPLLTYEAIHTDRVYITEKGGPAATQLKAMLSGDGAPESMSPYYAVSWERTDEHFTALVSDAGPERLTVQVFSHAPTERTATLRLWQLEPGTYRMTRTSGDSSDASTVEIKDRGQRVPLELPPQMLLTVRFERVR